jgi:hypothetical protein
MSDVSSHALLSILMPWVKQFPARERTVSPFLCDANWSEKVPVAAKPWGKKFSDHLWTPFLSFRHQGGGEKVSVLK